MLSVEKAYRYSTYINHTQLIIMLHMYCKDNMDELYCRHFYWIIEICGSMVEMRKSFYKLDLSVTLPNANLIEKYIPCFAKC